MAELEPFMARHWSGAGILEFGIRFQFCPTDEFVAEFIRSHHRIIYAKAKGNAIKVRVTIVYMDNVEKLVDSIISKARKLEQEVIKAIDTVRIYTNN